MSKKNNENCTNNITSEALGSRIRSVRKEKGISIQKLSNSVGVERNFISQIEAGYKFPSFKTLIAIINTLEVSADELLYDYVVAHDPTVVYNSINRKLDKASEAQLRRIEAHIELELELLD